MDQGAANRALTARRVLNDCRAEYVELRSVTDLDVYRRRWFALVTMLRSVGHVLGNTDARLSESHREAVARRWPEIKAAPIFKEFIDGTRSSTIKEYRSGAVLAVNRATSPMSATASAMSSSTVLALYDDGLMLPPVVTMPPYPFTFVAGAFAGESVYDVIERALGFWDQHVSAIEQEVGNA